MKLTLATSLVALSSVLAGCGEVVPQNQVGIAPSPAPVVDAGVDAAAPLAIRTVEARNPFGNLDANNLVLDGDFELTGRQGQMPWLNFSSSQATLDFETGGLCASGVRCAKVTRASALFGWMASPKAGSSIQVSIKARMLTGTPKTDGADGTCPEPKINVYVIDIDNQATIERIRLDRAVAPVNGFCTYQSVVGAVAYGSPGIYVEPDEFAARDVVLVDAAVATVVPAAAARAFVPSQPPSAASKARIVQVSDWVRRHRKLTAPRSPNPND